ncbi:hypothetical protein [Amycolatopsis taiwanensis]|uniref:hypothetical protein n=1 Tax=Amycolatopsis taiwanensis TaxID=342230 RepID=UPI0004B02C38|nr:hypothetical protein [Amycolatopsis taiwanensis]
MPRAPGERRRAHRVRLPGAVILPQRKEAERTSRPVLVEIMIVRGECRDGHVGG